MTPSDPASVTTGYSSVPAARLAWSESRLAGVRWLHLVGDREAVFTQLGTLAAQEIRAVQEAMPERAALRRWLSTGRGEQMRASLLTHAEEHYPEQLLELAAMARGADVDVQDLLVANLRGDVGVPDGTGCTDVAIAGPDGFAAHNEDGAPTLNGNLMFLTLAIDDEPVVTVQWYPGFLPCNAHAVTSSGLAWGINHIQVRDPADAAGRHFLARRVQRASSLDELISWMTRLPTAGGFAYTIGDMATGRVLVIETAAGQTHVHEVPPGELSWHTNHLRWLDDDLDRAQSRDEATDALGQREESEARGKHLSGRASPDSWDAEWFFEILSSKPLPDGVLRQAAGGDPLMTLMTTVVDLKEQIVSVRSSAGERADLSVGHYLRLPQTATMKQNRPAAGTPGRDAGTCPTPGRV